MRQTKHTYRHNQGQRKGTQQTQTNKYIKTFFLITHKFCQITMLLYPFSLTVLDFSQLPSSIQCPPKNPKPHETECQGREGTHSKGCWNEAKVVGKRSCDPAELWVSRSGDQKHVHRNQPCSHSQRFECFLFIRLFLHCLPSLFFFFWRHVCSLLYMEKAVRMMCRVFNSNGKLHNTATIPWFPLKSMATFGFSFLLKKSPIGDKIPSIPNSMTQKYLVARIVWILYMVRKSASMLPFEPPLAKGTNTVSMVPMEPKEMTNAPLLLALCNNNPSTQSVSGLRS